MINIPNVPNVEGKSANTTLCLTFVRWDSDYKNVRLFKSKDDCKTYCNDNRIYSTNQSRIKNNYVDVAISQSVLQQKCNYLYYANNNETNNIYFAFITNIESVSSTVSRIHFKIDVFQTYYYNCTWYRSFVEREHIAKSDDIIGANIQDENIRAHDYYRTQVAELNLSDVHWYVYCANNTYAGEEFNIGLVYAPYKYWIEQYYTGKMLLGCFVYDITIQNESEYLERNILDAILHDGKSSEIALVQAVPTAIIDKSYTHLAINKRDIIEKPIYNNKCYTYPYTIAKLTNYSGANKLLKLEQFSTEQCVATIYGQKFGNPIIQIVPNNYANIGYNLDESITYSNFPQGSYTNQSYNLWLQGNKIKNEQAITNSIYSALAKGNEVGLATAMINIGSQLINNSYENQYARTQMQDSIGGSISNDGIAIENDLCKVGLEGWCATNIQEIDNYFSMYGYATNQFKIPNTNNRSLWNFVKTNNATLNGNIAEENLKELSNIFNNGVFIWHTSNIGQFDYANNT